MPGNDMAGVVILFNRVVQCDDIMRLLTYYVHITKYLHIKINRTSTKGTK